MRHFAAVLIMLCVWCSPVSAQDRVFSFNNAFNDPIRNPGSPLNSPVAAPVLDGFFTGANGKLTGFVGTFDGSSDFTIFGVGSPALIGTYSGTSTSAFFTSPLNFTVVYNTNTYTFGSSGIPTILNGTYTTIGNMTQTAGSGPTSFGTTSTAASSQIYSGVAVPEIDGAVLPRALLITLGLMFLIGRLRSHSHSLA